MGYTYIHEKLSKYNIYRLKKLLNNENHQNTFKTIGFISSMWYNMHANSKEDLMVEFHDLNNKRVCDVSEDGKQVVIIRGGCRTMITVSPSGHLQIVSDWVSKDAS